MDASVAQPVTAGAGEGPHLELDGFSGPLAALLRLAREHAIDLARFPMAECIRQLIVELEGPVPPLTERADWLVMAAWLVLLRSRLLLPAVKPAEEALETGTDQPLDPWRALQGARALATWLERRPQLGIDVFARGQPELVGTESAAITRSMSLNSSGRRWPNSKTTPIASTPARLTVPPGSPSGLCQMPASASCSSSQRPQTMRRSSGFCRLSTLRR